MTTQLSKPVTRRIGELVVTLREDGLELRGYRKQRSVVVPFEEIAKRGLMRAGVSLTERQWCEPLEQVRKLSGHLAQKRREESPFR